MLGKKIFNFWLLVFISVPSQSFAARVNYNDANVSISTPITFGSAEQGYFSQEITNTGTSPAFIRVTLSEALGGDNEADVDQKELLAVPSTLVIPPGGKRVVRTVIMEEYDASTYREFFAVFAPEIPLYEGSEGLNINIAYSQYIGVFKAGQGTQPQLSATWTSEGALRIQNSSDREVVVFRLNGCVESDCSVPVVKRTFSLFRPGTSKLFTIPDEGQATRFDQVRVTYQNGKEKETVDIKIN